jgi:hypothetical protein
VATLKRMPSGGKREGAGSGGIREGAGSGGKREGAGSKSARKDQSGNAAAAADEVFFCSVCDTGHDFKTLQNLNQHEKRASHKRKLDPEFAAAEEAEKAAKKAARDTKETARLKETDKLRKRHRTKAEKELASKENQRTFYAKLKKRNTAPPITETGTEEDVLSALVRYHGSTSAAMLLHDDDEKIKSNIEKFINVSPEAKSEIRKAWQESEMALNTPYLSCASCGIRNHGNYAEIKVATLPDFFKFKAKDQVMFDVLKGEISLCCCHKLTLKSNLCRGRISDG